MCYVFFPTSCTGILHIQTFHTLQNSEIPKKLYVKLSQDTLCLHSSQLGCWESILQHQSLSTYQLQVAVCHLFPEVFFSACAFSQLNIPFFPTSPPVRVKVFDLLIRISEFLHSIFSWECFFPPKSRSSTYFTWISLFLDYCTFPEIRTQMEIITKLC